MDATVAVRNHSTDTKKQREDMTPSELKRQSQITTLSGVLFRSYFQGPGSKENEFRKHVVLLLNVIAALAENEAVLKLIRIQNHNPNVVGVREMALNYAKTRGIVIGMLTPNERYKDPDIKARNAATTLITNRDLAVKAVEGFIEYRIEVGRYIPPPPTGKELHDKRKAYRDAAHAIFIHALLRITDPDKYEELRKSS